MTQSDFLHEEFQCYQNFEYFKEKINQNNVSSNTTEKVSLFRLLFQVNQIILTMSKSQKA